MLYLKRDSFELCFFLYKPSFLSSYTKICNKQKVSEKFRYEYNVYICSLMKVKIFISIKTTKLCQFSSPSHNDCIFLFSQFSKMVSFLKAFRFSLPAPHFFCSCNELIIDLDPSPLLSFPLPTFL